MDLARFATTAAAALAFAVPASAGVLYSTSFEGPTFSPGSLNGQGGWVVTGPFNPSDVTVENTFSFSGSQAVEFPTAAGGGSLAYYSYPFTPTEPITVSMEIDGDGTGGTPAFFGVGDGIGSQNYTAAVGYVDGRLFAYRLGAPENGALIGTFAPSTWVDVSMTLDYATQTFSVFADGKLLASGLGFCGGLSSSTALCEGNHVSQFDDVEFISQGPKNNAFYIDDVSISAPEPGTWVLMLAGFAGLGAMLRSPRRPAAA